MSPHTHFDQSTNDDSNDDNDTTTTTHSCGQHRKKLYWDLKAIETGSNKISAYTTTTRTIIHECILYTGVE